MRARFWTIIVLAALAAALIIPSTALAIPQDAVLLHSETRTITGVELANQMLADVRGVTLGSSGATVTLDVDGLRHDVALDVSDVAPAWGEGFGGIAIVAGVGIAIMKAAAMAVRFFR